jgi:FtsK/SpoIIIE family
MSSIQSDAAALVAAALVDLSRGSAAERRLFLGRYLGLNPTRILDALLARADATIAIPRSPDLDAIRADGVTLLPYLVVDAQQAGRNRGSQGFAALLRSEFANGAPDSERRVLLVLDANPVETVRSSSEDASRAERLSWKRLCADAVALAVSPSVTALARAVADELKGYRPDAGLLDRFADFCATAWPDTEAAGRELHMLGLYLSDPNASSDLSRLRRSARWRRDLDRWIGPSEDLERRLRRKLGPDGSGVEKVLGAVGPLGIDYSQFTLDDLAEHRVKNPLRLRRPVDIGGARSVISSSGGVACWLDPGGADITFMTSGDIDGGESIVLQWAGGSEAEAPVEDDRSAVLQVRHDGWRFGRIVLTRRGQIIDGVDLACYCANGTWFPIESGFAIDAEAGAFRVEGEPAGLAVASRGAVLGPVALELPITVGPELPEGPIDATATLHAESHSLPLLLVGRDFGGDTDWGRGERGTDGPDDDASSDESDGEATELGEGEGDDSNGDRDLAAGARQHIDSPQPSPIHAYLASVRANPAGASREIRFNPTAIDWEITIGGEAFPLASQRIGRFDGLALERAILARPDTLAFTATLAPDGEVRLVEEKALERLSLAAIDPTALAAFKAARRAFFLAVAVPGSAYALAQNDGQAEAIAYVDTYASLLNSLPLSERYQPEFDRILLVDSVIDAATGDRFLAPTNPLTVAFYMAFIETAQFWSRDRPEELMPADLGTIKPDYLLPMFRAALTWYEVVPVEPFLWRGFQPVQERGPVPGIEARLISERLRFFLTVHPVYNDPKQRIRLTAIEPGDARAVVHALRRFYRSDYAVDEYKRPGLDVHLMTADGRLPAAIEDLLAGSDDEDLVDTLIRTRVRISGGRLDAGMPFSHVTFVFRTPTSRRPEPQDMSKRASTLYVGGLAASPGRAVEPGVNEQHFAWGTFAAEGAGSIPGGPAAQTLPLIARTLLELVGGQPRELMRSAVTRMATTTVPREFMAEEYARSVWVVHLDHVLGLEAFGTYEAGPGRYLIDYEESPGGAGLGGVTATSRIGPYRDTLTNTLKDLEHLHPPGLARILRLLNSVSGRWALRLLRDNRERILERIGTVAAIAVLDELDASFGRDDGAGVMLPLDELFERLRGLGISRPGSRSSDDLLYLWLPYGEGPAVVRGRLLEVKYRSRGGPELGEARQEIENTIDWLSETFNTNGPSRLFRGRDLAETIRSSASRGMAFELMRPVDRERFEAALSKVAAGDYALEFAFWIAGRRLVGDVISVELESESPATRTGLPGAGEPAGLIRLGRPVLRALATGEALSAPPGWVRPQFDDPDSARPAGRIAPRPPDKGTPAEHGTVGRPRTDSNGEARPDPPEVDAEVRRLARELDSAVLKYGLELEPFQPQQAQVGPSVIRFRARPLGRQSLEGVARRAVDLGREVGTPEGVLVAQEPYFITIDVPRRNREVIRFEDFIGHLGTSEAGALKFLVGMAASGDVTVADLARLPHLLIAGATGSGKSVFLRSLLCSLLEQHSAKELSILLVDPKQVDFLPFEDLPHLIDRRIIFNPAEAVAVLADLIDSEIAKRRPILKRAGVTNVLEYYEGGGSPHEIPQIVVVVDEFADLGSTLGRGERAEFMSLVQRFGQITRAFGIHLVLATQRPSVQVITGDIKANMTARVALKVQAPQDSVTILGHGGAEALRDKGDLLFEHGGESERLQGFLVTPRDVAATVSRWPRG